MHKSERWSLVLLILPALAVFSLVVLVPFFSGFYYSLTDWDGISKEIRVTGLENYGKIFQSEDLLTPFQNTLGFTAFLVIVANILAVAIATAIHRSNVVNNLLRSVFFLPFIISLVVASYMWTYLYSAGIYPLLGIANPLGNPDTANLGIAIISVWRNTGYCVVIYIAAFQTIPESLYEAADIDGASGLSKFFRITLPSIVPAFTVNVTLLLGWGLKEFDTVMAATGGGPGSASMSVAYYIYKATFAWGQAGFGQALAIVLLVGIVIVTGLVARLLRSREIES